MSLEARSLTFRYPRRGKKPVLEHVNLTLEPGERVGLTAPSGRGKTTLCKLLAGYERPTAGESLLDGRPLSHYRGACPVQMIWQHPETVLDPLLPLEVSLKEAGPVEERLLEELHIQPQWLRRYPRSCPAGSSSGSASPGPWAGPQDTCCATRSPPCWTPLPRPRSGVSSCGRRSGGIWGCSLSATAPPFWSGCAPGWRFSLPLRKKRRPSLDLECTPGYMMVLLTEGAQFSRFYFQEVLSQ